MRSHSRTCLVHLNLIVFLLICLLFASSCVPGTSSPGLNQDGSGNLTNRPLGVTFLGLNLLCCCASVPLLVIVALLGYAKRANRPLSDQDNAHLSSPERLPA